jgi:hypothetical protein
MPGANKRRLYVPGPNGDYWASMDAKCEVHDDGLRYRVVYKDGVREDWKRFNTSLRNLVNKGAWVLEVAEELQLPDGV